MQFLRGLFMVLGLATLAACGGDSFADTCNDNCSQEDCDGNKPNLATCKASCERLDAFNSKSGCDDKGSDALSCDGADSCEEVTEDCRTKVTAYLTCIANYCEAHSDDTDCAVE